MSRLHWQNGEGWTMDRTFRGEDGDYPSLRNYGTPMRRGGFTVIEILVVVSILLILAGLLQPVLARAKGDANRSSCAGNLRQLGVAISLYTSDFDHAFPSGMHDYIRPSCAYISEPDLRARCDSASVFEAILEPYIKDKAVYRCPSDYGFTLIEFYEFESRQVPTSFLTTGSSYLYNDDLYQSDRPDFSLPRPSETNLISDRSGAWHPGRSYAIPSRIDRFASYQGFRYNNVFVDGHAGYLSPSELNVAWGNAICEGCKKLYFSGIP